MNALVKLEPIRLPPANRPTRMPSLPAWLASQKSAAAVNLQPVTDQTGEHFADVLTLPPALMPSPAQRAAIESHVSSLISLLNRTPQEDNDIADAMLTILTKMLFVLPGAKTSELGAEAKGDAYMMALDDLPVWAVEAAVRRWFRGECGEDERGRKFDYRWAPDPARLRSLAREEAWIVRGRVIELQKLLTAVPFIDCSADLERGRMAMRGLHSTMGDPEALSALTFEGAVSIGRAAK